MSYHNNVFAQHDEGALYVRLGARRGALHIHPNFAQVRRAILRTHSGVVAPGAFLLREPGYFVYTRDQLRAELNKYAPGKPGARWQDTPLTEDADYIYALFKVKPDPNFLDTHWDGKKLMDLIEAFETDQRNRPITNLGRTSAYPRLISLEKLLATQQLPR